MALEDFIKQKLWPLQDIPQMSVPISSQTAPSYEKCIELWQKYGMWDNIKRHSLLVAHIATSIAERGQALGIPINSASVRAAGLLHDLAKTWCIDHGGSHALLGASWTQMELCQPEISQGVLLHVFWPWPLPKGKAIFCLPILVLYADRRCRHDQCVTIDQRYEDLLLRYGKDEESRARMLLSYQSTKLIEKALSELLGWNLHEDTFDCGRVVF